MKYLVVDDYGTGGIWFFVIAASENEIREELPTVKIYAPGTRPDWMSEGSEIEITHGRTYDVRNLPSSPWMDELR
jgi:hypothetical protein